MTTSIAIDRQIPLLRLGPQFRFFESVCAVAAPGTFAVADTKSINERYFVIISICDYVRISREAENGGVFSPLNPFMIDDLREGRARLLLDLSNEGPAFNLRIFSDLNAQLESIGVPQHSVTFISQNRLLQSDFTTAFPHHQMRFWSLDYFPSVVMAEFNGDMRHAGIGDYLPLRRAPDKLYNCLNAAPRWHRILMFRWLQRQGLLDEGLVSFHGIGSENRKSSEVNIQAPPSAATLLFPDLLENLASSLPVAPIRFDDSNVLGNGLASNVLVDAYARSSLSIITESDFFDTRTQRITEKTVKALVMGHPFIIVGPARSLEVVRSFGFRTFSAAIDHSYDLEDDDGRRFAACLRAIENCLGLIRADEQRWNDLCREDAEFNFQHGKGGFAATYKADVMNSTIQEMRDFTFR